jgi:hypothetical protein
VPYGRNGRLKIIWEDDSTLKRALFEWRTEEINVRLAESRRAS